MFGCRLLDECNTPTDIYHSLLIIGSFPRVSAEHYEALAKGNICKLAKPLLSHPDARVRGFTCNLVGSLGKHNDKFYEAFHTAGLLPLLVQRCEDSDSQTRTFACYAIGNAGIVYSIPSTP